MEQYFPGIIRLVEAFGCTGQNHHRELQSLTLMDGHNTNRIVFLTGQIRFAEIHLVLLQLLNVIHKMEQSMEAGVLIGYCQVHKLL